MDNSEILSLVFELKEKILNSSSYKELKEKEKLMLDDEECFELLCMYQNVQEKYKESKRFEKYGSDLSGVSKELSEVKYLVDENKFVKDYNKSYQENHSQLKKIEKLIFKDIVKERKEINIE